MGRAPGPASAHWYHAAVRRLLLLNGVLAAAIGGASAGVPLLDRSAAAVDVSVRSYAAAVSAGDLEAAVAQIAPPARARWREWIAGQLGNIYEVRGVGVRAPSLLERVAQRADGRPTDVTVALDVNRGYPDEFYQPTTRVAVEQVDGRWYLAEPLLEPESESSSS
jgi:hypothetical protein